MRVNPFIYGVLVVLLFFGIIFSFQAAGIWSISGKVDSSGKAIQPSVESISSIKGWMTLEQVTSTFDVPLGEILQQFNLPADTLPTTAIKDLESETFDTTALAEWLQNRIQLGDVTKTTNVIPIATQTVTPTQDVSSSGTVVSTDQLTPDRTITGNTTFQNLLGWNVSVETIQMIIGGEIASLSIKIKDYVIGQGLEFIIIKTQLQTEVDKSN